MPRPIPQSYVLRLWREQQGAPMRITLVEVGQPDECRHFGTLAECFAWLYGQTDITSQPATAEKGAAGDARE